MKNDDVIVYTCITGNKDTLKEFEKEKGVKYICFSDIERKSLTWDVIKLHTEWCNPRLTSRYHKANPHIVLPDHSWSVWIDGSIKPKVRQIDVIDHINKGMIGLSKHFTNNCIYEEMNTVLDCKKETEHNVEILFKKYKDEKFPIEYGLHMTGMIVRRNTEPNKKFNSLWWDMIKKYSIRDQLSFDYVRWVMNYRVDLIKQCWYKQETHKHAE